MSRRDSSSDRDRDRDRYGRSDRYDRRRDDRVDRRDDRYGHARKLSWPEHRDRQEDIWRKQEKKNYVKKKKMFKLKSQVVKLKNNERNLIDGQNKKIDSTKMTNNEHIESGKVDNLPPKMIMLNDVQYALVPASVSSINLQPDTLPAKPVEVADQGAGPAGTAVAGVTAALTTEPEATTKKKRRRRKKKAGATIDAGAAVDTEGVEVASSEINVTVDQDVQMTQGSVSTAAKVDGVQAQTSDLKATGSEEELDLSTLSKQRLWEKVWRTKLASKCYYYINKHGIHNAGNLAKLLMQSRTRNSLILASGCSLLSFANILSLEEIMKYGFSTTHNNVLAIDNLIKERWSLFRVQHKHVEALHRVALALMECCYSMLLTGAEVVVDETGTMWEQYRTDFYNLVLMSENEIIRLAGWGAETMNGLNVDTDAFFNKPDQVFQLGNPLHVLGYLKNFEEWESFWKDEAKGRRLAPALAPFDDDEGHLMRQLKGEARPIGLTTTAVLRLLGSRFVEEFVVLTYKYMKCSGLSWEPRLYGLPLCYQDMAAALRLLHFEPDMCILPSAQSLSVCLEGHKFLDLLCVRHLVTLWRIRMNVCDSRRERVPVEVENWLPDYATIFLSERVGGMPVMSLATCQRYGYICPGQIERVLQDISQSIGMDGRSADDGRDNEEEMHDDGVRAEAGVDDGVRAEAGVDDGVRAEAGVDDGDRALRINYLSEMDHYLPSGLNVSFADVVKSRHENNQPVVPQPGGQPK